MQICPLSYRLRPLVLVAGGTSVSLRLGGYERFWGSCIPFIAATLRLAATLGLRALRPLHAYGPWMLYEHYSCPLYIKREQNSLCAYEAYDVIVSPIGQITRQKATSILPVPPLSRQTLARSLGSTRLVSLPVMSRAIMIGPDIGCQSGCARWPNIYEVSTTISALHWIVNVLIIIYNDFF